jgi:hypothetical protein
MPSRPDRVNVVENEEETNDEGELAGLGLQSGVEAAKAGR